MRLTISITDDLHKKLQEKATLNFRTISQEVAYLYHQVYEHTDTHTSKESTPPMFIAPDTAPTPRPDPFPESPYKITCDVKTPIVTQIYTSEQDHITQSPDEDYDPTRLTPYTYKADDFTFKSPAEELPKIPISSITVPALVQSRRTDATIEYFEQDNTIQYHIPTDTFIPTSYFGTLLTDIACHNQRDLPVLSTAEKLIIDYIYNLYPPETYVPALLLNMKDALDDPDKLETEQDQILFSMLQKDGDHRHRDIPTECDYIEKKYLEVHPE